MKRVLLVLVVVGIVGPWSIVTAAPAAGCSCAEMSLADAIEGADLVVAAEQLSRHGGLLTEPTLTLIVHGTFVGEPRASLRVHTGYGSSDCGVDFSGAGVVGVLAYEHDGEYSVNSCSPRPTVDQLVAHFGFEGVPFVPVGASDGPGLALTLIILVGSVAVTAVLAWAGRTRS